jgi:dihydrofolate reductase
LVISLIVAASENNAIGKNNQLLWHLPKDMKFFKNITWAMPVVMGRKTFESMGNKPLPGRKNIVITKQTDWEAEGVAVVNSVEEAVSLAEELDYKEIFIIGGGEIFMISFGMASKIYMTRVHLDIEGDVFFPVIERKEWELKSSVDNPADDKHAYAFTFELWERKIISN